MSGALKDVTTDQRRVGKPMVLEIKGDYQKQDIKDIKIFASFDHRSGIDDLVEISLGSYPVRDKKLSDSKEVTFILKEAKGQSNIRATLKEKNLKLRMENTITQIDYETQASSREVKELLDVVARDAQKITINAESQGTFSDQKFQISSNLASIIQKAVQKQLQRKIDETTAKLKNQVEKEIKGEKDKFNQEVNKLKAGLQKEINQNKEKFSKIGKGIKL